MSKRDDGADEFARPGTATDLLRMIHCGEKTAAMETARRRNDSTMKEPRCQKRGAGWHCWLVQQCNSIHNNSDCGTRVLSGRLPHTPPRSTAHLRSLPPRIAPPSLLFPLPFSFCPPPHRQYVAAAPFPSGTASSTTGTKRSPSSSLAKFASTGAGSDTRTSRHPAVVVAGPIDSSATTFPPTSTRSRHTSFPSCPTRTVKGRCPAGSSAHRPARIVG